MVPFPPTPRDAADLTVGLPQGHDWVATERPVANRILVIDSHPRAADHAVQIARSIGFEVKSLHNSNDAIEAFIAFRPDIVWLDLALPETDGIELLDAFFLTGIPTQMVVLSAFGQAVVRLAEETAAFHHATIAGSLRKPLKTAEMLELLSRLKAPGTGNEAPQPCLGQPMSDWA